MGSAADVKYVPLPVHNIVGNTPAMARTPFNTKAATDLGKRLTALRKKAGNPSNERIGRDLERYQDISVSAEQIRKAHAGLVDPFVGQLDLLAGLAHFYGVEPEALGSVVAARLGHVLVALGAGDLPRASLRCTALKRAA